ncbi:unnamed protein product, partial [Owenia fusiformis]
GTITSIDNASEAATLGVELSNLPDDGYKEIFISGWTGIGIYTNQHTDGKCLVITNYRNKDLNPEVFYDYYEDCSGRSELLCEIPRLSTGCPSNANDFFIDNSCYSVDFVFDEHDRNSMCCQMKGGTLVRIDSQYELTQIGIKLKELGIEGKGTSEFSVDYYNTTVRDPLDDKNCLLYTNQRYKFTDRTKYTWASKSCLSSSQHLCELPKPDSGCPSPNGFNSFSLGSTCYLFNAVKANARNIINACESLGATVARIDSGAEAGWIGDQLAQFDDNEDKFKEIYITAWTGIGVYENQLDTGSCLIITNYRNRNSQPGIFYDFSEDCSGKSQLLCELPMPTAGCPDGFNYFEIGESCYLVDTDFNEHDRNSQFCQQAYPGGVLLHIDDEEELLAVGDALEELGGILGSGTNEFSHGPGFPVDPATIVPYLSALQEASLHPSPPTNCMVFSNKIYSNIDKSKFIWDMKLCEDEAFVICETPQVGLGCPSDFSNFNTEQSCYNINKNLNTYALATAQCKALGGTVLAIDSPQEAAMLGEELAGNTDLPGQYTEFFLASWNGFGKYDNENSDGSCSILTNYRNKDTQPTKFYTHSEDCSGKAQMLCELVKPISGCPEDFDDIVTADRCYLFDFKFNTHDRNRMFCRMAYENARLITIGTDAERELIGSIFVGETGTLFEFSLGTVERTPTDTTSCMLFSNQLFYTSAPDRFSWIFQDCLFEAEGLCEAAKTGIDCPSTFDLETSVGCYKVMQASDYSGFKQECEKIGGNTAVINTPEEASELGNELAAVPGISDLRRYYIQTWAGYKVYENQISDFSCLILTNYRYQNTTPEVFYDFTEDCSGKSELLCEMPKPDRGCPTKYDLVNFEIGDSCYFLRFGYYEHDINSMTCAMIGPGASFIHINSNEELAAVGDHLKRLGIAYKGLTEFSIGLYLATQDGGGIQIETINAAADNETEIPVMTTVQTEDTIAEDTKCICSKENNASKEAKGSEESSQESKDSSKASKGSSRASKASSKGSNVSSKESKEISRESQDSSEQSKVSSKESKDSSKASKGSSRASKASSKESKGSSTESNGSRSSKERSESNASTSVKSSKESGAKGRRRKRMTSSSNGSNESGSNSSDGCVCPRTDADSKNSEESKANSVGSDGSSMESDSSSKESKASSKESKASSKESKESKGSSEESKADSKGSKVSCKEIEAISKESKDSNKESQDSSEESQVSSKE